MTTRNGYGRPRPVASAAGRAPGPAVHTLCRVRLQVDSHGFVKPRSLDDRRGYIDTYQPGTSVELDFGQGTALMEYDAVAIAEAVAACDAVYLVSTAAYGARPHVECGAAFNADGVLHLMRLAIDHLAARRTEATC
jgi:hypothetical protein